MGLLHPVFEKEALTPTSRAAHAIVSRQAKALKGAYRPDEIKAFTNTKMEFAQGVPDLLTRPEVKTMVQSAQANFPKGREMGMGDFGRAQMAHGGSANSWASALYKRREGMPYLRPKFFPPGPKGAASPPPVFEKAAVGLGLMAAGGAATALTTWLTIKGVKEQQKIVGMLKRQEALSRHLRGALAGAGIGGAVAGYAIGKKQPAKKEKTIVMEPVFMNAPQQMRPSSEPSNDFISKAAIDPGLLLLLAMSGGVGGFLGSKLGLRLKEMAKSRKTASAESQLTRFGGGVIRRMGFGAELKKVPLPSLEAILTDSASTPGK